MGWSVGRSEGGCYVEEHEPYSGEAGFESEAEAVRYAIECEQDLISSIRPNLRYLQRRLRALERQAHKDHQP